MVLGRPVWGEPDAEGVGEAPFEAGVNELDRRRNEAQPLGDDHAKTKRVASLGYCSHAKTRRGLRRQTPVL